MLPQQLIVLSQELGLEITRNPVGERQVWPRRARRFIQGYRARCKEHAIGNQNDRHAYTKLHVHTLNKLPGTR